MYELMRFSQGDNASEVSGHEIYGELVDVLYQNKNGNLVIIENPSRNRLTAHDPNERSAIQKQFSQSAHERFKEYIDLGKKTVEKDQRRGTNSGVIPLYMKDGVPYIGFIQKVFGNNLKLDLPAGGPNGVRDLLEVAAREVFGEEWVAFQNDKFIVPTGYEKQTVSYISNNMKEASDLGLEIPEELKHVLNGAQSDSMLSVKFGESSYISKTIPRAQVITFDNDYRAYVTSGYYVSHPHGADLLQAVIMPYPTHILDLECLQQNSVEKHVPLNRHHILVPILELPNYYSGKDVSTRIFNQYGEHEETINIEFCPPMMLCDQFLKLQLGKEI